MAKTILTSVICALICLAMVGCVVRSRPATVVVQSGEPETELVETEGTAPATPPAPEATQPANTTQDLVVAEGAPEITYVRTVPNLFYHDGLWWYYYDGFWYSSHYRHGPWLHVHVSRVPHVFYRIHPNHWKMVPHHRPPVYRPRPRPGPHPTTGPRPHQTTGPRPHQQVKPAPKPKPPAPKPTSPPPKKNQ